MKATVKGNKNSTNTTNETNTTSPEDTVNEQQQKDSSESNAGEPTVDDEDFAEKVNNEYPDDEL